MKRDPFSRRDSVRRVLRGALVGTGRPRLTMRARASLAVGALVAAAFAYACTLTDVTGVPVGVVTIQPPSVTLVEGASVQLSAQVKDRLGGTLPNGAVTWSIENPSLISVSENGLVQALLAGETSVRATIDGVGGTAEVIIQPGPRIRARLCEAFSQVLHL